MAYPTMNIVTNPSPYLPNISLITEIRSILNDPAPGLVANNTQLLNWINRAANIMAKEGKCQEIETTSFPLVTNTTQYTYNACSLSSTTANAIDYVIDIEAIIYTGVTVVTGVDLPAITAKTLIKNSQRMLNHLDQNTSGPPVYWCDTGKSIRVWPVPSANEDTFLCSILFYRNANTLKTDSDTSATYYVPNHMREYVIWYTLSEAWKRKGRLDVSRWYRSLFDKFVMYHRQDRLRKPVDSMEDMTIAEYTQIQ